MAAIKIAYPNGDEEWRMHGKRHRNDGPALVMTNGYKEWRKNGKLHRADGPAVESSDGALVWYQHGELHREDGPAVELANGKIEWWVHGVRQRVARRWRLTCRDSVIVTYKCNCVAFFGNMCYNDAILRKQDH